MGVAERKAADNVMATRMKHLGIVRVRSQCCICHNIISTGAKKVGGVEILPDVYTHVAMTCTGPARKQAPRNPPAKVEKWKGPSKYNVRDTAYWATGRDYFERERARYESEANRFRKAA